MFWMLATHWHPDELDEELLDELSELPEDELPLLAEEPLLSEDPEEDELSDESLLPLLPLELDELEEGGSPLDEEEPLLPLLSEEPELPLDSLLALLPLDSLLPLLLDDELLGTQGSSHISGQTVQRPMKVPPALIRRQTFGRQLVQEFAAGAQSARPMPKDGLPQETKVGFVTLKAGVPLMSVGQPPRKMSYVTGWPSARSRMHCGTSAQPKNSVAIG